MRKKIRWIWLLGAMMLAGCGKQIPKDVIQPDRMEGILYDYHLSTALSTQLSSSENYKKEALRKYVFQKHHITEAEFDSSMVWYTRHTVELSRIYASLGKRFREEKKAMSKLLAARENRPEISLPGDTVDVWYGDTLYWLLDTPLGNRVSFTIPVDSNFKAKDAFRWTADYIFLSEKKQRVTMGLNILFDNDSVAGCVKEITRSGTQSLYVAPDSAYTIRSINGFIYLAADSIRFPGVLVNDIALTRYHAPLDTVLAAKVSVDSMAMGKIKSNGPAVKGLAPREMKEMGGKSEEKVIRSERIRPRRSN